MVDTLLLRPVPVQDPSTLYQVFGHNANRIKFGSFSIREYDNVTAGNQVFTQVIADLQVRARFQNRSMGGYGVSGNYFQTLGGGIALGRPILPEDELPSAPPVVVLSHARWQGTFNGDQGSWAKRSSCRAIAWQWSEWHRQHSLDSIPCFPTSGRPYRRSGCLRPAAVTASNQPDERSLRIIGRLRPGVTETQAQSVMSVLLPRISESRQMEMQLVDASLESRATYQSWNHADMANVLPGGECVRDDPFNRLHQPLERPAGTSLESQPRDRRPVVTGRQPEPYRSATGHGDGRALVDCRRGRPCDLPRELDVDTPCNGIFVFDEDRNADLEFNPDYRVFVFAFVLALATGIVFGLAPALHATRSTLNSALRAEGSFLGSRFRRSRLRDGLVIAQFAFSLVLLIGAGLLLHSTIKFGSVQPGFDVAHSISIQPIQGTYSPNPMLIARLRERLQATPGARVVAAAMREPLRGSLPMAHVSTGPPQFRVLDAGYNEVTPEYFSALEIPFVRGRAFTMEEARSGAPVAVISEATAKRFWPGEDPIGKTFEVTTPEYSSGGRELFLTGSVPEPSR